MQLLKNHDWEINKTDADARFYTRTPLFISLNKIHSLVAGKI